jgi:hypothetical protein
LHFRDKIVKQEFFGFFYPNFREADPDSKWICIHPVSWWIRIRILNTDPGQDVKIAGT